MTDQTASAGREAARQAAFSAALTGALRPPATPADLRAGVLAAIAREVRLDWQARREELQGEHSAAIAKLNRRYLRRCRDALLLGACLLALLAFSAKPLAVGLAPLFADAAPMVAGFLTFSMGVLCGAALLQDLFGWKRARG